MATLNTRQGLLALLGIVAVAAAGWLGWQHYSGQAAAPAPAPAAKAPATSAADQDKLIREVLALTGMQRQLEQMPEQVKAGMALAPGNEKLPPNVARALEKIIIDAFAEEKIDERMTNRLKEQYKAQYMQAMLTDFSAPLPKRMVAMEGQLGTPTDQAAFFQALASKPLPPSRVSALQALDHTVNASDLSVEMAGVTASTMLKAMVGDNPTALAQLNAELDKQRPAMEQNVRNGAMAGFAYVYREANDDDINAYAKLYARPHVKWFSDIAIGVMKESVKHAAARIGERFGALLRSSSAPASAAQDSPAATATNAPAPKPAVAVPDAKPETAPAAAPAPHKASRPRGDLRKCLELGDSRAIAKCAAQSR